MALVKAHIELGKTEAGEIAGAVARFAAFGGLAIALVILALILLVIGSSLFLAEWLLGSMGWGVLHGFLLFIGIAVAAVLIALGIAAGSIGRALLIGVIVAIVVGMALGLNLPNQLYVALGDRTVVGVEPGVRPLLVGLVVGGLIGLVLGLVAATLLDGGGVRIAALVGLLVLGLVLGAFTAINFGPQTGAGVGITIGYIVWIALMGVGVARTGIDVDALKKRFYPSTTIDTSKETLEWLKKRMPPGIGS
ncbi:MAG: hypothetical protein ABJC39_01725 [Chloroflexota bacterium]